MTKPIFNFLATLRLSISVTAVHADTSLQYSARGSTELSGGTSKAAAGAMSIAAGRVVVPVGATVALAHSAERGLSDPCRETTALPIADEIVSLAR